MIFGMPVEQLIQFANFLGLGLLGVLAAFGLRYGKKTPTPVEHQLEVAGALVDSKAVKQLAEAIEAHTREAGAQRTDAEKSRQLGYRLIEAINHFTGEVSDLRQEIRNQTMEIARKR
ncbi:MAG: hypothetical protein E5X34_13400 [Mesorhizobium sp.]|uniref:hypothetical protein n=1 Tax=Mesorhizobium sp. TaxID=1871066 RepID=UPI001201865C|nr:hypothetical protein [Mesorhizobium sp.]TIR24044.1 MAG: hypothetical protein E5X34_13400 [Mesorhizobium sp.]